MMHVALQIVGKALFSVEIGDRADDLARATLTVLDHIVFRAKTFGMVPPWLPTPGNLRARAAAVCARCEAVQDRSTDAPGSRRRAAICSRC